MPTAFLGHLSDDAYGRELLATLEADGVDVDLVSVGHEKSTLAIASIDGARRARYEFVVDGTAAPQLTRAMLPDDLDASIEAICLGSLGLVLEPMASTLMEIAEREQGRRVIVLDPNVRPGLIDDSEYRARLARAISISTIVKASDADLAWMYPDLDPAGAAERVVGQDVRLVVVTLGEEGALAAHGPHRVAVPAPKVEVVDTIGAGDAFCAALLAWLHARGALTADLTLDAQELREALEFACGAAAITCSRAGADPPRRHEVALPG